VKDETDELVNDEKSSLQSWSDEDEFNAKAACLFVIPAADLDFITQLIPDVCFLLVLL